MNKLVRKLISGIFFLQAFILSCYGQHPLLMRQPAINKDGSLVAFSFQGDIWTVPATGGRATRITIHDSYEGYPQFSPDGIQIAFSGSRYGNYDLFVVPVKGLYLLNAFLCTINTSK